MISQLNKKTTKQGFTLVEILVVVALIAMLGSFGGIAVRGAVSKVKDAKATKTADELARAIQLLGSVTEKLPNNWTSEATSTTDTAGNIKQLQTKLVTASGASITLTAPDARSVCFYQNGDRQTAYAVAVGLAKKPPNQPYKAADIEVKPAENWDNSTSGNILIAAYEATNKTESCPSAPNGNNAATIDCDGNDYCIKIDLST